MLLWLAVAAAVDRPGDPMPDRLWDVTHLDLDVTLDVEGRSLSGTATHTLAMLGRPRDRVRLHQRALTIDAVRVDGEDATWTTGHDWIEIPLPPGPSHTVAVDYQTRPAKGLYFRGPRWGDAIVEVFTQGQDEDNRWWYPGWDHPNDRFTVATHITAPSALIVRGLGRQTGRETVAADRTRWSFRLDQPVVNYLVALVAGEYQSVTLDGPVPVEVLAARTLDPDVVARSAADLPAMLAFHAELLDEPYPYDLFRMVYVQRFLFDGMESPTLTVMNDRLLVHHDTPGTRRRNHDVQAHEVAHHWFGDLVTCHGWNPWWLNEGFARYLELRWAGHRYGPEVFAANMALVARRARRYDRALEPTAATREPDTPIETWTGVYAKGATLLHDLHGRLGPTVFDAAIAAYLDRHREDFVEGHDLRRSLERTSGVSLVGYFDRFVSGRGLPAYEVTSSYADGTLTLTITPDEERPTTVLDVDVAIGTEAGERLRTLRLDERATRLQLPLEAPPRWILVDPESASLVRFTHEQPTSAWSALARQSARPFGRIVALHALGEVDDPAAAATLLAVADAGLDIGIRRVAIHALGGHAALPTVGRWLRGLALDVDSAAAPPMLRSAAASRLANTPADRDVLARVATDDPDPLPRRSALRRLRAHDAERAAAVARSLLRSPDGSFRGEVHADALSVLGGHGRPADDRALRRGLSSPRHRVQQAALQAVAERLGKLEDGRRRTRLQDDLAVAVALRLDDPETRARSLAVQVARHLRVEHVPLLERFRASNPIAALDDAASDAIRQIRSPRTPAATDDRLEALEERVESLRDGLDRAEQRLDRLDEG